MANGNYVTISTLVGKVKNLLEGQFRTVAIEGEVTNFSLSSSGHYYFTLSDRNSSISACLFKMDAMRNPGVKTLKDGDIVQCFGSLGVYAKRGSFQIIVKRISKASGVGDLKEKFELLKKKLSLDGLFDLEAKLKIPELPKRVAVITALRGAALADFLNIMKRRTHWIDIMVVPTLVQGDGAAAALRKSLFNTIKFSMEAVPEKKIDVIVLTRGGGSLEDLWAFNDEALAWDIFNCPIPTISAVGHQVDYSISDFVSDLRCETPSAAAQILSEGQTKILSKLDNARKHLNSNARNIILNRREKVSSASPEAMLRMVWNKFQNYKLRVEKCSLEKRDTELIGLHDYWFRLDDSVKKMTHLMDQKIQNSKYRVGKSNELLSALNPNNVLDRGYSYLTTDSEKVVSSKADFSKLKQDEILKIRFHDGVGKVSKV
ncbi:exodeoxyribonuclease VII large subunit [Halobacteriovorax marinus]|uniref:Exodeoxyribonuclease 7 large subunit n=1 Tax=Halobacteriovorax marinus TaxID=97084 RepID=A0A1Y5FBZ4_9BACT|nr:exodeoxyribonuclease VII large subunit [Halobacteriovorax marinus]